MEETKMQRDMARITLIKEYRKKETLRLMEPREVIESIRRGEYAAEVECFRNIAALISQKAGDEMGNLRGWEEHTKGLPRICFAEELENRNHQRLVLAYTGMVLLEVNNLTGNNEAEAVRQGAAEMPQTVMAFVGADGQSVKIVCRGELFPGDRQTAAGPADIAALPKDSQAIQDFHEYLYERARLIYNGQLGVTVEKLEPQLQRICYMSHDPEAVYNPLATPIYAHAKKPSEQNFRTTSTFEPTEGVLGANRYTSLHTAYEFNLTKAYDGAEGIGDEDEWCHEVLTKLARYCMETGVPMRIAQRLALLKPQFHERSLLVEKVFENAYREELVRKYREKHGVEATRHMPPETLLMMKIDMFLNANYELRKNIMRGVAEYRLRSGIGFAFMDLTEEARNSITMRALEQGIKCWDKDIRRYVNSNDIELYDPVNDYLEQLPKWDGRDRVDELARRVPTQYAEWPHLFRLWMRSMVAMWLGKGQLTGNALVPLLIGRQGCGKSSFCRILLPHKLADYYNDRINFKNESDLNLGLTSFALINLDEFDKITNRQQVVLKYLVSTSDLKYRPPYGKAYSAHRRYASFIGTTNDTTPLSDPSGSRRFICISIDGDIDFESPIDHDQLYAQLKEEIAKGQRYWPTKDEERQLMTHNLKYQHLNGLGEMLMSLVQRPKADDPDGQWMSLKELSALLKKHFHHYKEEASSFQKIGSYLSRPDYCFENKRVAAGTMYFVKLR